MPKCPTEMLKMLPIEKQTEILDQEFLAKVNKQSGVRLNNLPSDCWEWIGSFTAGYGQLTKIRYDECYAHRWSYKRFVGDIPEGKLIRHKCDNRKCVNPAHLEIGTKKDNNQDARERNPRACGRKLQPEEYPKILERWTNGELLKDIAKEYGMNWKSISRALKK